MKSKAMLYFSSSSTQKVVHFYFPLIFERIFKKKINVKKGKNIIIVIVANSIITVTIFFPLLS